MNEPSPPRTPQEMDLSLFGDTHVRAYRESRGAQGYVWNGAQILLLTTKGRSSGQPRTTPLIFVQDGENYVVIASRGGAPTHPDWYLNLQADPHAEVQVEADVFQALARTAESPEREGLWAEAVKVWPQYEDYKARTERQIPVVVLEPMRA